MSPERDPFRPQDPWKAEWDQHTERYRGDMHVPGGRFDWMVLLARSWRESLSCCC
jgi:hypothetical protein